jgi:hypothetical protein
MGRGRFCKLAGGRVSAVVVSLGLLPGLGSQTAVAGSQPDDVIEIAQTKLLSEHGSTRATRYAVTNKIITIDGKTHVAWLDSISNTMVATYDHASGRWGQAVKVGSGTDNHGGPALTRDSQGYLHVIFGPHADVPFQHCRSAKPNDSSEWIKLDAFGHHPTYPSAVCDEHDALHVIYRGGLTRGHPFKLIHQRRTRDGVWTEPRALAEAPADWKGYTHYHSSIAIAVDQTLHVAYNLYYNGAAKHAGHMTSRDRGKTWELADGSPLDLPVGVESNAFFARTEEAFKVTNVVCDSAGHPWISLADARSKAGPTIYHHDGNTWRSFCPAQRTAPRIPLSELSFGGSLTIDSQDGIYVGLTLGPHVVGGLKGDVVLLYSVDRGKSFRRLDVFPPDVGLPHTGLSLERPTGHNVVETPWLLFSTGEKGPGCFGKGIYHEVRVVELRASP